MTAGYCRRKGTALTDYPLSLSQAQRTGSACRTVGVGKDGPKTRSTNAKQQSGLPESAGHDEYLNMVYAGDNPLMLSTCRNALQTARAVAGAAIRKGVVGRRDQQGM